MAEASERESTDDPKAWELEIRKRIRDSMEAKNIAQFPRPVHHRNPNFVGAPIAADKLAELEEFRTAECVKVNPDTPQKQVRFPTLTGAQSAWEMLREEDFSTHITTSCSDLDNILGGGISCREVTEIGGVPGIGKTQLGIQLAVNVQIPLDYGGLEGKAIYIDTEGSFMVERALQIAEGCVENMLTSSYFKSRDGQANQDVLDPKQFLANIFYFRICSYTEQIGLVNHLDKFISENQNVKIVIIDSITFHFRQDFEDLALRTRVLSSMALKLMKLAQKFNLAVVLLNQVTTKYVDGSYQLALALGDSWSHASTNRLILYWNDNERCAYIDKSPSLPSASASYAVTAKGIRNGVLTCKRIKLV